MESLKICVMIFFFNTYFITKICSTLHVIVACCLCLYVRAAPELYTQYKQATITALRQNVSL